MFFFYMTCFTILLLHQLHCVGLGYWTEPQPIVLIFTILIFFLDVLNNPSRVVNVSSLVASKFVCLKLNELTQYKGDLHQYQSSKLCQILFTIEFARRFAGTNVKIYSLHPGLIKTNIWNHMNWLVNNLLDIVNIFCKVCWIKSINHVTYLLIEKLE